MPLLLVLQASRLKDEGRLHSNAISLIKRNSCYKVSSEGCRRSGCWLPPVFARLYAMAAFAELGDRSDVQRHAGR